MTAPFVTVLSIRLVPLFRWRTEWGTVNTAGEAITWPPAPASRKALRIAESEVERRIMEGTPLASGEPKGLLFSEEASQSTHGGEVEC